MFGAKIIRIENGWYQKIINPKAKGGMGLTVLRVEGIAIYGRHRGWGNAAYFWMDMNTAKRTGIIPENTPNNEEKINAYLNKFVRGQKIILKGPKIKIPKVKKEEKLKESKQSQQERKTVDFTKEKKKFLKKMKQKQEDFRKAA